MAVSVAKKNIVFAPPGHLVLFSSHFKLLGILEFFETVQVLAALIISSTPCGSRSSQFWSRKIFLVHFWNFGRFFHLRERGFLKFMIRGVWRAATSRFSRVNLQMKKSEEQRALEVLNEIKTPRGNSHHNPRSTASPFDLGDGSNSSKVAFLGLALRSLGVIYGDIGTSPLYVIKSIFSGNTEPPSPTEIIGACSCILWALILLGSLKYVAFILKADNKGICI